MISTITAKLGGVGMLVNNAGVARARKMKRSILFCLMRRSL